MKTVVIGDSHIVALGNAYRAKPQRYEELGDVAFGKLFGFVTTIRPFFDATGEHVTLTDPEAQACLKGLIGVPYFAAGDQNRYVISMAFTTTFFLRLAFWDNFRPWRFGDVSRQPLSDAMVRRIALEHFKHPIGFFAALRERGLSIIALEAPPPRMDDQAGIDKHGRDGFLEVNRLSRESMTEALAAMGVPVIGAPEETLEEAPKGRFGFLKPEFWNVKGQDRHHANRQFGHFALKETIRVLAQPVGTERTA
jgi:hypothetical protein